MRNALLGKVSTFGWAGCVVWLLSGGMAEAAVGRTEATYGVSATGAASYEIPVPVTEGIGSLTPRLTIRHAGAEARGILGTAMSLAGLSLIAPCRRTIAQDGGAGAIQLNTADKYCLDGARLRLVSGSYGGPGAVYRTELEQYARITSFDTANGQPGWFKVEARDGLIYEYGHASDAVFRAGIQPTSPIQLWALTSVRDRDGNTIVFRYQNDPAARLFRPDFIRYTDSTLAGTGHYTVRFIYQPSSRPDLVLGYTPSAAGTASRLETGLLERLELRHDEATYRQLLFTYETGAGSNTRLHSVQTCAATTADCFPATTFTWQSATVGHAAPSGSAAVTGSTLLPLDLNGDGFEDLVWANGTWRYMLGGASGYGAAVNTGVTATNPSLAMPLDWNGDGRSDLLIDNADGYWRVLTGSTTVFGGPHPAGAGGIPSNTANSAWWLADVDGDGRDDLLRAPTTGAAQIYVRLNSASGFGSETLGYNDANLRFFSNPFPPTQSYRQSIVRRPDFDGDGRSDLLAFACTWDTGTSQCLWSGWFELTANGTGFVNRGNLPGATLNTAPALGQFNADGLTDVAFPSMATNTWCVGLSQGGAGFALGCGASTSGYWTFMSTTADYDGDGYDDLYVYASYPVDQWHVLRSTGSGVETTPIATGIPFNGTSTGWVVGDPNGDGLPDLGAISISTGTWQTRVHLGLPGERLASATDAFGVTATFTWGVLTDPAVHTKYATTVYPTQELQRPWWVVRQLTATDGSGTGSTVTQTFSYEGARRDVQGRGFLGFARRVAIDASLGYNLRTEVAYSQAFPYIGRATSEVEKQSSGTRIRELTNTWTALTLGAGYEQARYPYVSSSTTQYFELGGAQNGSLYAQRQRWVSAIDSASGRVTDGTSRMTEFFTGLYPGQSRTERVQHTSVLNDTPSWCLGRPQTSVTSASHTLSGGTTITRTEGTSWDAAKCRPTQRQLEPGSAQWQVTTAYGYDGFGNRTSVAITGVGMTTRTDSLSFGSRGQRPESASNALGQSSSQSWDYALGVATSATDPNGLVTTWTSDSFGRRTLELRPDQTRTAWDRSACLSGCDPRTRYRLTTTELDAGSTAYRTTLTDVDQFERAFQVATQRPGGGYSLTTSERDARGRVTRQYLPHWSGSPHAGYLQYAYDALDRVTAETTYNASGGVDRSRSTAYNGLSITRTNPRGMTTTEVQTAWGDRVRVTDALGNYAWYRADALGRPTHLIDPLSNSVRITAYNVHGARTSLVDLNRGTTTYTPNALGGLLSETDAKNQTRTFAYDALGRMTTRSEPEGTSTWTWGASAAAHNIGRLASVAGPGLAESYTYDSLGRPATRSIASDATYQYDFAYNGLGRLDTLTYPTSTSGYRLKLAYDYQYGELHRIRDYNDPGTVPWQLNALDASGRVLDETLGAGVQVVSSFDQPLGRLSSRQAGVGGGAAIQNLSYHWDQNDNLIRRQDDQQSPPVFEYFYYDNLDRLDYSTRNGATNLDLAYDALGNVTSKSDVGNYTYHATKKHAVTAAGSNNYGYDANGNMTSRNGSTVLWTSYDLPLRIDSGAGTMSYLWYGPDRALWRQEAYSAGSNESTIYVGELVEKVTKDGITTWKHYVEAPTGTAAVYLRRSDGTAETYYLTHDHLGSTDKVLNATGGVVTVAESFTALGARRGSNWQGTPTPAELAAIAATTRDGFTGHDMLDAVGLVHMGGRVYDPAIGRFLSVDPIVRDSAASQSWNGYGYVEGRMLSATDPTGFGMEIGVIGGVETVTITEQSEPCGGFGILCNVNIGWEMRQYLQNWGPTGPSQSTPGSVGVVDTADAVPSRRHHKRKSLSQEEQESCVDAAVRLAQAAVGSVPVVAGLAQTVEGVVQVGVGVLGAPETFGGSLAAVPGGIANATLGSVAVIDGGMLLQTAWAGSGDSYTTSSAIGQSLGGEIGAQAGDYVNFLAQVISAARSPPTSGTAAAVNAFMLAASSMLPSAGTIAGCPP